MKKTPGGTRKPTRPACSIRRHVVVCRDTFNSAVDVGQHCAVGRPARPHRARPDAGTATSFPSTPRAAHHDRTFPGDGFLPSDPPPIVFISLRPPSLRDRTHTQRIVPSHTACHHVARNPSVAAILRRGFRNFVCSSSTDQGQLPSTLLLLQSALVYVNTCSKKFSVFSPLTIEFLLDSHSLVVFFLILYYFICSVRGLSRHALYAFHAFYACSSGVSHPKIIQLI